MVEFIDRAYYPDYHPSVRDWEIYFKIETAGRCGVGEFDLARIKPLFEAKGDYDLQIKMVISEMAEWWAKGWGWGNVVDDAIDKISGNAIMGPYKESLEKVRESFRRDPIEAITSYTGLSGDEKNRYLSEYEARLTSELQKS